MRTLAEWKPICCTKCQIGERLRRYAVKGIEAHGGQTK